MKCWKMSIAAIAIVIGEKEKDTDVIKEEKDEEKKTGCIIDMATTESSKNVTIKYCCWAIIFLLTVEVIVIVINSVSTSTDGDVTDILSKISNGLHNRTVSAITNIMLNHNHG
jgi:hypothetical protein